MALRTTKNTSPGEDQIYYTHLKNLPISALDYLAKIYETTLKICYFPDEWNLGITILIPKPGKDLSDPKSYRPITLLSALGKTLERIIIVRLKHHLENNELIPETQAGFRKNRSTQDQLFRITQDITVAFQRDQRVLATFFDIEKAFDKLWIEGLILKLKDALGLKSGTIAIILSFLTDRFVKFRVGKTLSTPLNLKAGTPQGSILSPTLFNIGVSDIPQSLNERVKLSQYDRNVGNRQRPVYNNTTTTKVQRQNNRMVQRVENKDGTEQNSTHRIQAVIPTQVQHTRDQNQRHHSSMPR